MVRFVEIGYKIILGIVFLVNQFRIMQLPEILKSRRTVNNAPGLNRATLLRAIVHYRDARPGAVHQLRPLGDAGPVIAAGGLFAYARQTGMIAAPASS